MAKVIILANGNVGLEIAKLLRSNNDEIVSVYWYGTDEIRQQLADIFSINIDQVRSWSDFKSKGDVDKLISENADFYITVYWPFLLRGRELLIARDSINFHPALLPINRGWYPHVHSILDGSPTGVTLHRVSEKPDAGDVWCQEQVDLYAEDIASDIYQRLQDRIIKLFAENWPRIRSGDIIPKQQDEAKANYHGKNQIDALDRIDLDRKTTAREVINILRARTFHERGFAYFIDDKNNRVQISVKLKKA